MSEKEIEKQLKIYKSEMAKKGGDARTKTLSSQERSAIAKKAANARWSKSLKNISKANHTGELKIGDTRISCAVLEDGKRVLSERSIALALGRRGSGAHYQRKKSGEKGALIPEYLALKNLEPFIDTETKESLLNPIGYISKGGMVSKGLEASLLPKICNIWLIARDKGALKGEPQNRVAEKADILIRGLAQVGIIALVDEATGYQNSRARNALEKILEQFIAKELRPWMKTFPNDYYEHIFRLNKWPFPPKKSNSRPPVIGKMTNDIIYERLAPGVLDELKKQNPLNQKGRRKNKHFQYLTEEIGYPKLREHFSAVIALMRLASSWGEFKVFLNKSLPKYKSTKEIPFEENV